MFRISEFLRLEDMSLMLRWGWKIKKTDREFN